MKPAETRSSARRVTPSVSEEPSAADSSEVASAFRSKDAAVTLVISVVFAFIVLGLTFVSQMGIAIRCQSAGCTDLALTVGDWLLLAAPWLILAVVVVVSIMLIRRRVRAFYVPLLGISLAIAVTVIVDRLVS